MKEHDLISIIVPIYNVEQYLEKCINSILNQTYTNLEIILVDDGSPDNSGKICDEYAKKDNRIKVIHKENGGISSARNTGLKVARGAYVGFIDSDDYIEKDMYEILYKNVKKENADISICSNYDIYKNKIIGTKKQGIYTVMTPEETIIKMNSFGYFGFPVWNKLYKKELFYDLRFLTDKKTCEDWYFLYEVICKCKKIVYQSVPKYYYCLRENSLSQSNVDYEMLKASEYSIKKEKKKYQGALPSVYTTYVFIRIKIYNQLLMCKNIKDRKIKMKQMRKEVKKNCKKIDKKELNFVRNMQLKLIRFLPIVYNGLLIIYYKRKNL